MSNILKQTADIDVTVVNINAIKVNGKCVVYTGTTWVRQAGFYTEAEIEAIKEITERLNENRLNAAQ